MDAQHTITLQPSGERFEAGPDTTLLRAAESAGLELPSSCRNGTCRTCICRLASGQVAYQIEWPGLSFDEKREGWILPCVALARSDLVLEAPLARRRIP
ncbi:(2Fe-2S)-binding protein [Massilia sp. KIM]|uniref:2Fe-2S iron-sulfur cluster-binding protein n=1 Tax=Massilia sp. KIM TaxID=1955422 RepID=UPI00098FDA71|nr:2Fe-2S iron-sulfur cluster-binding protein [Massilia sp. KIM]OON63503.1 (2Fe-2S)-binding protein [Massilia sp. KIM]